jgi:hypothetical protein
MIKYENRCCDCETGAYPCRGATCPLIKVPVTYCDECDEEIEGDVYEVDDEELCEECLKERFRRND